MVRTQKNWISRGATNPFYKIIFSSTSVLVGKHVYKTNTEIKYEKAVSSDHVKRRKVICSDRKSNPVGWGMPRAVNYMLWQSYVALASSVGCRDGDPKRQRQLRCVLFSRYIYTKLRIDFRGVMPRSDMRGSTLYIEV